MSIRWIEPVELVKHELNQLGQEGRDVREYRKRWTACLDQGAPAEAQRTLALAMLDELQPLTILSLSSDTEPSTLRGILSLCGLSANDRKFAAVSESILADRIAGGWFGRAAGCLLGKPVEKLPRDGIRQILTSNGTWPLTDYITEKGIPPELLVRYPWNVHSGRESLRENIRCMPEDDDMNYPMINLSVLEAAGPGFSTDQIAAAWLEKLPVLSTFTAEQVAYLNYLQGLRPPHTALYRNPYREWIGAQIRGDIFGWVSPGNPRRAVTLAHEDARLSHVRNGMYGEMFVAAMTAAASVLTDLPGIVETGLSFVPPASRLAHAIRFALSLPASEPTWEGAVDRLHERFGAYHWVHTINNAALLVAALLYGNGNFEKSICNVVMGGWDTDSNGATVGSVVGTMTGAGRLPDKWIAPLHDRIRTSLKGLDNFAISQLAEKTVKIALSSKS